MFEIIMTIIVLVLAVTVCKLWGALCEIDKKFTEILLLAGKWATERSMFLQEDDAEEYDCQDCHGGCAPARIAMRETLSTKHEIVDIKCDVENLFRLLPKICRQDKGVGEVILCLQKEGCACEEADGEKDGEDCECATCENNTREQNLCVYHDAVYCDNCGIGNGYGRCGYGGEEDGENN